MWANCGRSSLGRLRTPLVRARRGLNGLARAKEAWNGRLVLAEEVEHAIEKGGPIISLESTIITHGMPYPTNLTTAQSLERILRSSSVTPATIAILDGKIHVGLTEQQLQRLSDPENSEAKVKVSRRDLAPTLSKGIVGGTTVASTMYISHSVGIGMFVTGGIGGAHRGSENSMDVSADLIELGRTPVAVVCAGAKSILDIPRTLEVLETQGVCVTTYGSNKDFPAFYTPSSGHQSPWSVDTPASAASLIHTSLTLPDPLSVLLAVPIPSEHKPKGDKVQIAVEQAVKESIEQGIDKRGKEVTPWLLKRVGELTGGSALELNVKLIENNARVGAAIAVELSKTRRETKISPGRTSAASRVRRFSTSATLPSRRSYATEALPKRKVVVFGSAALDVTSSADQVISPRSTTPGEIFLSPGGVGRNIAEAAQNLLPKHTVQMITMLGSNKNEVDLVGKMTLLELEAVGLRIDGVKYAEGKHSPACSLILDQEFDLVAGVADMGIIHEMGKDEVDSAFSELGERPDMIVFDCNPRSEVIEHIIRRAREVGVNTFCDPTSVPKAARLVEALRTHTIQDTGGRRPLTHIGPNLIELEDLANRLQNGSNAVKSLPFDLTKNERDIEAYCKPEPRRWISDQQVIPKVLALLPSVVENVWLKAGSDGLLHATFSTANGNQNSDSNSVLTLRQGDAVLTVTHFPAIRIPENEIVSTTGAGDTLVGGLVAGLVNGQGEPKEWVQKALQRVERTMRSRRAVG